MATALHQENDAAESKTAPGIFFAEPLKARPVLPSQVTETHLESVTYVFDFAPGCVVAPNSTLPTSADIIAGGGLLAANGNASVEAALRQKALLAAQRVYGEVGSLRPTEVEGPGDPNSLFEVMQRIAGIAYETPTRVAAPLVPDLRNPQVRDIFADIQGAVDTRISPGADRHFVIWPSNDGGKTPAPGMSAGWPYTEANKISTVYGPFQNTGSKNASDRYVFIYTGVK